jgi:hypothetical protein
MKFDDETIFDSFSSIIRHENIVFSLNIAGRIRKNKRSGPIKAFQLFTSGFASPWTIQTSCASRPEIFGGGEKKEFLNFSWIIKEVFMNDLRLRAPMAFPQWFREVLERKKWISWLREKGGTAEGGWRKKW